MVAWSPTPAKLALLALGAAGLAWGAQTPVILISIDTLRADRVGIYGGRGVPTPGIDGFADGGTLFASAEAQVPLTLPSHTSLLTSNYPFQSGVEVNAEHVPASLETLAGVLHAHGYRTAAFIGSVFLERQLGLDRGFDEYDSPFSFEAFSPLSGEIFFVGTRRNLLAIRDRRDGNIVVHAAESWLASRRGQPVFAFVHLFDLHTPYNTPPGFQRPPGSSGYDAQLAYVDRTIASFRQALVRAGWWDRSLVILVSDHGEGLGEHSEETHGYFAYESTLHVPLIVHWPSGAHPLPARDERPAGLIDVAPTILDFLGMRAPAQFAGLSLLGHAPRPVYSETFYLNNAFGWSPLRALRNGALKYIDAPHPELYDLQRDPRELHNVIAARPADAQSLRAEMSRLLARYPILARDSSASSESPRTAGVLRSLGYLSRGPRSSAAAGTLPDPKDRLSELHLYEDADAATNRGDLTRAMGLLNRILASDLRNTLARRDLGVLYVERNRPADARACLERVVAVAPDDYVSQYELALAYEKLGQRKTALGHMRIACALAPHAERCQAELRRLAGGAGN